MLFKNPFMVSDHYSQNSSACSMFLRHITIRKISDLIKELGSSRTISPNSFQSYLLNLCRHIIAVPFCIFIKDIFAFCCITADKTDTTEIQPATINTEISMDKATADPLERAQMPTKQISTQSQWPAGTTLIVGDSMLGGIKESRMGPKRKVRSFPVPP